MTLTLLKHTELSRTKIKHIQATRIWAFAHSKDELNYEEHRHLEQCKHCDAVFKYFAIFDNTEQVHQREEEDLNQCA